MATDDLPIYLQLTALVVHPRESLDTEYKDWFNWRTEEGKATIAKAVMALANHGGGYLVLGFEEMKQRLESRPRPQHIAEITQDGVNAIVARYAEPAFHCEMYNIEHPESGTLHPVVKIPGSTVPVTCRREQKESGILHHKIYIRKPGPKSEEPKTAEDWRILLNRCVRAERVDLLNAIRTIVTGQTETQGSADRPASGLERYCQAALSRWQELVSNLPVESAARFPHGYYEMGFLLVDATPADDMNELRERLWDTQTVKLSGWTPFSHMRVPQWAPYIFDDFIEAWLGRAKADRIWNDPVHADFWRASLDGKLYTIRGYIEDGELATANEKLPGTLFSDAIPSIKIAEGFLFASRLAALFTGVEQIEVRCRFTGLQGRSLLLSDNLGSVVGPGPESHQDEVPLTGQFHIQEIHNNLAEIVHSLVKDLYVRFGFYTVPVEHVHRLLSRMRRYS